MKSAKWLTELWREHAGIKQSMVTFSRDFSHSRGVKRH